MIILLATKPYSNRKGSEELLTLKTIDTGSSGNCYILTCNNEKLILDCGLPIKAIKQGLDFDLQGIQGVLVTHCHKDHSLSVDDFKKMGFDVWQPYLDENKMQRRYFGGFMVCSFDVPHDDVSCVGYLIECPNGEKLLYATDFEYIKYSFRKMRIQHALIECNYCKELVEIDAENRSHVLRGHAEMHTTLSIADDNKDSLQNVILCHLSNSNSDSERMVAEIQKIVPGANVCVAERGLEVELRNKNECPF